MGLKRELQEAMKAALKEGDKARLGAIRLILNEIKQREIELRRELSEEEIVAVLGKMVRQRLETIQQYRQAGREDLAEKERLELEVIRSYLPEPLSEEELDRLVEEAIAETGAKSLRDMGKVMASLRPKVQGRADMGLVSQKVKERLGV